jgi:PTS system mannose-specific IID component
MTDQTTETKEVVENADQKPGTKKLDKKTRLAVCNRHQYLQGSWNYERMQNGGWCYSIIPAIKALYDDPEDQKAALKRHLEFYNTHPYVSAPVMGVTLALEEERANGAPVDDAAIQGVKVGMMGPLAGVGDPVFWYTVRPLLGALGASLAMSGSIAGPILFFVAWNVIRIAFLWYTQEFGYRVGTSIAKDLSGGLLGKVTEGASLLGMFIIGALVERWVSISFTPVVSSVTQSEGAYIDWSKITGDAAGIKSALEQYASLGADGLNQVKVTTLQENLDSLIPGLCAVGLTLLICKLLKKGVSPIVIILCLFAFGIVGRYFGFM